MDEVKEQSEATEAVAADESLQAQNADDAQGVGTQEKGGFKQYFTARRIAYIAMFTALSLALRFLSFPLLPVVSYLKLDFSDVFVLICGYSMGPVAGVIAGVLKETIYGIIFTQSAFVGELANIIILVPFVLLPSIMYKKHKGIKSVIFWLSISCLIRVAWSFPVNLLLNFPAFTGFNWTSGMKMFLKVWYWVMLYNLIKTVILAVLTVLLYKSVSRLIKLINKKFDAKKEAN